MNYVVRASFISLGQLYRAPTTWNHIEDFNDGFIASTRNLALNFTIFDSGILPKTGFFSPKKYIYLRGPLSVVK